MSPLDPAMGAAVKCHKGSAAPPPPLSAHTALCASPRHSHPLAEENRRRSSTPLSNSTHAKTCNLRVSSYAPARGEMCLHKALRAHFT